MIGMTVCSGIGAPEVAAPEIDWVLASEIEAFPRAVLSERFGYRDARGGAAGRILWGDFTTLRPRHFRRLRLPLPDIIVAGTPCQSFSVAGLRGGLGDPRGNLTLAFVRLCDAIDNLRRSAGQPPAWIVWENVPGVFSVKGNAFGAFLGGLVGSESSICPPRGRGWTDSGVVSGPRRCAAWRVLDAQYHGLAQRRKRVYVVARGGAGNWAAADALLPLIKSMHWHPPPSRGAGQDVARPIAACAPGGSGYRNDADTADNLIAAYGGNNTSGPIDVSTAVNAHGGPHGRLDFESETFVEVANTLRVPSHGAAWRGDGCDNIVAHSLRAEGFDASEDGTGRGTPLVPVAYGTTQVTSKTNRSSPAPGDPCHPLAAGAHAPAIAFSCKDHGADALDDLSPTLRAGGHDSSHANAGVMPAAAFASTAETMYGVSHADAQKAHADQALRTLRDAVGEEAFATWGAGIVAALWPQEVLRSEVHGRGIRCPANNRHKLDDDALPRSEAGSGWTVPALWEAGCDGCPPSGWQPSERLARELGAHLSLLPHQRASASRFLLGLWRASEGLGPLREALSALQEAWQPAHREDQSARLTHAVRRLTPREAERLQGYPDDWTAIAHRGKPAADGPRYRALGNSMAVPVVHWLLRRLALVDAAPDHRSAA